MYDVIVVGARCAGSPAALLLARRGYRVLLLDRATFPSDTLSTHFVLYQGLCCLQRWGLLDRVLASGCPPVHRWTLHNGDFPLIGYPPVSPGLVSGCAPRRTVLDTILVQAAIEAGAELREGVVLQDLIWEGERVTGIRWVRKDGTTATEEAYLVIGADGMRSRVAQAVQAPTYHAVPTRTCAYYSYWADAPVEGVEMYPLGPQRRIVVVFPTNDGLVLCATIWPRSEFGVVRTDIEGQVQATFELVPALAARLRSGRRVERFRGTGDLPNFFRRPYGPGWALVGDAGQHSDPLQPQGIQNAFRSVEVLVEAIDAGLTGRRPLPEALADYERVRNEMLMPGYEAVCQAALFEPVSEDERRLRGALRGDQEATNWHFGLWFGTVSQEEFAAAEAVQRIKGSAAPS